MKNTALIKKISRYIRVRWRLFKRKPLAVLRYLFFIVLFRFLGVIVCLFLTVIPLPLNHFLQNLFNLNLSFNSVKDIFTSVKKMAASFSNLLPSLNDIGTLVRHAVSNIASVNPLSVLRELPGDLRQFFTQLFDKLRERLRDLKIFLKSLYPLKNGLNKLKTFAKTHAMLVKRIFKSVLVMLSSVLFVKILFLLVIPLLSIRAVYLVGVDVSLVIIAVLSLISSQLGSLLGRCLNGALLKLYDYLQEKRPAYNRNIIVVMMYILYAKARLFILKIRGYIWLLIFSYMQSIRKACLEIYDGFKKRGGK